MVSVTVGLSTKCSTAPPRGPGRGRRFIVKSAATDDEPRQKQKQREQPSWTGDTLLSSLANTLIGTPWLYKPLQLGGRYFMRQNAERIGVPWNETISKYERKPEVLEKIYEEVRDPSLEYPSYYTQPFHAYDDGNLSWEAAFEVECLAQVMAWRFFKNESFSGFQADQALRSSNNRAIQNVAGDMEINDIMDGGCSVGLSTKFLAQLFPNARVVGVDASPYFLSVAEDTRRSMEAKDADRISYVHALLEDTKLADASFDMISLQYVLHETPQIITRRILTESLRLLRPGGFLVLVDMNRESPVYQKMPPAIFTLMKSTEPWTDEYYSLDLKTCFLEQGFAHVKSKSINARHIMVAAWRSS